ncbi:unnamed protein product, partial [Vitis vinifera]
MKDQRVKKVPASLLLVQPGKKRPTESATKTLVPAKKAKLVSPQNTDGKKGGAHTATPHPNKKAGKTPATGDKGKGQSPKFWWPSLLQILQQDIQLRKCASIPFQG